MTLTRFAFVLPMFLVALPAFAADPQPAPTSPPTAARTVQQTPPDPIEQSLISEHSSAETARSHLDEALDRLILDRRMLRAQLTDALSRCDDRCKTPPAQPKPAAAEKQAPAAKAPASPPE
jgi:hypothetical protein